MALARTIDILKDEAVGAARVAIAAAVDAQPDALKKLGRRRPCGRRNWRLAGYWRTSTTGSRGRARPLHRRCAHYPEGNAWRR